MFKNKTTPIPKDKIVTQSIVNDGTQTLLKDRSDTELRHNLSLLEEREKDINNLCDQVTEVNQLFFQVNELVHDQAIVVDSIESNITKASNDTKTGVKELKKAEDNTGICVLF